MTLNNAHSQNWVVCTVRTPKTQAARARRAQGAVSQRCVALLRAMSRAWAPCHVPGRRIATQKAAHHSRYKKSYRDTPLWPGRASALPLAPTRRPDRVAALCCAPQHAGQAVLCPGARLCPGCRDTIHYIATKAGKWAIAHPASPLHVFFFSPIFFFCLFYSM